jgi:hypothetical protein
VVTGGGLGAPISTTEIPVNSDGTYTLTDLPFGTYVIENLDSYKGSFEIEGGYADPTAPNSYVVTISAENPQPMLSVRLLPPGGDGQLLLELYVCPAGLPGPWAEPWLCTPQRDGWDLSLASSAFSTILRTSDAPTTESGYVFSGLPLDYSYQLAVNAFPVDYPLIDIDPDPELDGSVAFDLTSDYSVVVYRFYAVTATTADLSGLDSDGDGLPDLLESDVLGTNPNLADSDGDSVWDGREIEIGTDPFDPTSFTFG